jgi:hypothetical protein
MCEQLDKEKPHIVDTKGLNLAVTMPTTVPVTVFSEM